MFQAFRACLHEGGVPEVGEVTCGGLPHLTCKRDHIKVARYSFSGSIPPKFEHKLRRDKQSFGKIATTVVLDKDENLL